jgi:membrane fusion protein (multidrug efflux system)
MKPRFVLAKHMGLFALLSLGLFGCGDKNAVEIAAELPRPVLVEEVGSADLVTLLRYGAELRPSTEVRLYSTVMDRILTFPWNDGDEIPKGDVVALVRKEGLDRGLDQVAAELNSLDIQIRNLASELERARDLLAKGVVTQQAFDQVRTSYDSTVARRKALVASRGQIAATAQNAVVKAPFTGVLAGKTLEVGDIASPQVPLGRLLVVDPLKVELRLIEADVSRVRPDQEVTLRLDTWPGRTFVGRVKRILPYLDPATRTNTVEIEVANPTDPETGLRPLKPGMYGRTELVVERRDTALVVPEEALLLDSRLLRDAPPGVQIRKVFVVDDTDTAIQRVVHLGIRNGSMVEILDGLEAGERLVIRGQHGLKDGGKVSIVEAAR